MDFTDTITQVSMLPVKTVLIIGLLAGLGSLFNPKVFGMLPIWLKIIFAIFMGYALWVVWAKW